MKTSEIKQHLKKIHDYAYKGERDAFKRIGPTLPRGCAHYYEHNSNILTCHCKIAQAYAKILCNEG